MICNLKNELDRNKFGNKAYYLSKLISWGFNVPAGFALDYTVFDDILKYNGIYEKVSYIFSDLNIENYKEKILRVNDLFNGITFDNDIEHSISMYCDESSVYAVRSSALCEDEKFNSFAGKFKTILNVRSEEISQSIISVYKSLYNEEVIKYFIDRNISLDNLKMPVIIQKVINGNFSGVAFTVNPILGKDKEIYIELVKGNCEQLVSGTSNPNRFIYDWFNEKIVYNDIKDNIFVDLLKKSIGQFIEIQNKIGSPVDIEFTILDNVLYILQAREITQICFDGYEYIWTTSDYRDGGIASETCKTMMWSFYEYAWNNALYSFFNYLSLIDKNYDKSILTKMFFSYGYWNLTEVKKAMLHIPLYVESEFDDNYGIIKDYVGCGKTYKFRLYSILKSITILFKLFLYILLFNRKNKKQVSYLKTEINKYENCLKQNNFTDNVVFINEIYNLTRELFPKGEKFYFTFIYFNTVIQIVIARILSFLISKNDKYILMESINNISHMKLPNALLEISKIIKSDKIELEIWKNSKSVDDIKKSKYFSKFEKIIRNLGYHSNKELDISYKRYKDNPVVLIEMIKNLLNYESEIKIDNVNKIKQIYGKLNILKRIIVYFNIKLSKKLFWWKEELRDYSIHIYSIIRDYFLIYSEKLYNEKTILDKNDIWFLKIEDVWDYIDNKITSDELKKKINKNKTYYFSFVNFTPPTEIYPSKKIVSEKISNERLFYGVTTCSGVAIGTAKVVKNIDDLNDLNNYEILIAKYIDTGWTANFIGLKAIVTEYGGTLCHTAIIAREYGIPTLTNCRNITNYIKDGDLLKIDADNGFVEVLK